jgi:hypothetical protein
MFTMLDRAGAGQDRQQSNRWLERGRVMPHADVLRTLVSELERVGVDADHMVAGLSAHASEAIRALRALPDNAGPAAFLARFRSESETAQRDETARGVQDSSAGAAHASEVGRIA